MNRLLTSDLWKEAAKIARKAKTRIAAIAYVTTDTVKFGEGDVLVTDASRQAITSGETSAKVLLAAFNRGAEVFSRTNLHAKVLILDDTAIIGSANLSQSSAEVLEECAVLTNDRKLVGQAKVFVQQLREQGQRLTAKSLEMLAALPVVRRSGKRHGIRRTAALGNRCWMVGITPLDEEKLSQGEQATRHQAELKAKKIIPGKVDHLDWVRLKGTSKMRLEAKPGDRVIMVSGSHAQANRLEIDAAATILSRADDGEVLFFYFDESEYRNRARLGKTEFVKLLREVGSDVAPTPRMVREISSDVFDALERHWPKS